MHTACKNIVKHRKDYFIAIVVISMAMAALVFLQLLVRELKDGMHRAIERSGFNIVTLKIADFCQHQAPFHFSYLAFYAVKDSLAKKFEKSLTITPIQMQKAALGIAPDALHFKATAVGIESDFFSLRPFELRAGELFNPQQFEQGEPVILISEEIKDKIFGRSERSVLNRLLYLGFDNRVEALRVVGIVEQEPDRRYEKIFSNPVFTGVYVPLFFFKQESFAPISFLTPKIHSLAITDVVVKSKSEMDYNLMHDRLTAHFDQLGVDFSESMVNFTNIKLQRLISASERLGKIFSLITILTETIVLTIIMGIVVRSRQAEIAIRKIEGAANWNVAAMFCGEGIGVALTGWLIGMIIGFALTKFMVPSGDVELSRYALSVFRMGLVISILVGVAATVIPAITSWQARPVEGLKAIKL